MASRSVLHVMNETTALLPSHQDNLDRKQTRFSILRFTFMFLTGICLAFLGIFSLSFNESKVLVKDTDKYLILAKDMMKTFPLVDTYVCAYHLQLGLNYFPNNRHNDWPYRIKEIFNNTISGVDFHSLPRSIFHTGLHKTAQIWPVCALTYNLITKFTVISVGGQFWSAFVECDPKMKSNSIELRDTLVF
ncbi:hypothetical protein HK096_002151 [Nowakowskiella sp. JEL0078]|nr:hypothetical protein HK096_002151 [Nowakowskiella sp. JEL0078]